MVNAIRSDSVSCRGITVSMTRGEAGKGCGSALEIVVGVIEPVLPDRTEHVELEGVFDRLGLVLEPRRNVQQLALADDDLFAADEELQRALQDVGHLLALVR